MISIIVPVYNCEKYLRECLDSLCGQTFQDIEIILINDGSTDGSLDICMEYQEKNTKIRYVEQKNAGVSAARNRGINLANGEFVMFVDSDDFVMNEYVEQMYDAITKSQADMAICGCRIIEGEKCHLRNVDSALVQGKYGIAVFMCENYLSSSITSPWAKIYKKSKIEALFDQTLSLGEDLLFNIEYFKKIESICVVPQCLYNYRKIPGSLTATYKASHYEGQKKIYKNASDYVQEIEEGCGQKLSGENVALKFYKHAIAFVVKQFMKKGAAYSEIRDYIKMMCEDTVFLEAVSQIKYQSTLDKFIITCIRHKWYMCIEMIAWTRARYKLMNRCMKA